MPRSLNLIHQVFEPFWKIEPEPRGRFVALVSLISTPFFSDRPQGAMLWKDFAAHCLNCDTQRSHGVLSNEGSVVSAESMLLTSARHDHCSLNILFFHL